MLTVFPAQSHHLQGSIGLGVVNQANSAFNHILNDLSLVVRRFEELSKFTAGVDRLGEFVEFLERREEEEESGTTSQIQLELSTEPVLRVEGEEHTSRCRDSTWIHMH